MRLLLLFLVLCTFNTLIYSDKELFNQCFEVQMGKVCVIVNSQSCYEVTGKVTLAGFTVWSESFSIPTLAQEYSKNKVNGKACRTFVLETITNQQCSLCTEVNQLEVINNDLNFCGNFSVNCTLIGGNVFEKILPACFQIDDCKILSCSSGCSNAGTCTSLGVCRCNAGHYGYDCSTQIEKNCIVSNDFNKTCWSATYPSCDKMTFTTTDSTSPTKTDYVVSSVIDGKSSLLLVTKRKSKTISSCDIYVQANDVSIDGNNLKGTPTLKTDCAGFEVQNEPMGSITLLSDDSFSCDPSTDGPDSNEGGDMGKPILIGMVIILVIALVVVLGYFAVKKLWIQKETFSRITSYVEDNNDALEPSYSDSGKEDEKKEDSDSVDM